MSITFGQVREKIRRLEDRDITAEQVADLVADYVAQEALRARDNERELSGLPVNPGGQKGYFARPGVVENNGLMDQIVRLVDRFRAAMDAALALADEFDVEARRFRDKYAGSAETSAYQDGSADSYDDAAERLRDALAPVADPGPHTTSDEETT